MIRETWQKLLFWAETRPISEDRIQNWLLHRHVPPGRLREFEKPGSPSRLSLLYPPHHTNPKPRGRWDSMEAARQKSMHRSSVSWSNAYSRRTIASKREKELAG